MPNLVQPGQVQNELVVDGDGSSNETSVSSLRNDGDVVVVAVFELFRLKIVRSQQRGWREGEGRREVKVGSESSRSGTERSEKMKSPISQQIEGYSLPLQVRNSESRKPDPTRSPSLSLSFSSVELNLPSFLPSSPFPPFPPPARNVSDSPP